MTYNIIIQASFQCPDDEIIGVKEAAAEALEWLGLSVGYIDIKTEDEADDNT